MDSGMEPEVRQYLKKVLNSFMVGLLWLLVNSTLGIYFGLAFGGNYSVIVNILFYVWFAASIGLLLWYYYRVWKK
jgi:FtsH-binding integral membrane protein